MSELDRRIRRFLNDLIRLLYDFFEHDELHLHINPLDKEGNPMTTTPPQPFPLNDDQTLPLGLALAGDNPNGLTITSATWSASGTVGVTPAADTLTATATTTTGDEGAGSIAVTATLSDGTTTLSATFEITVGATPVPLSLVVVPGTPTP